MVDPRKIKLEGKTVDNWTVIEFIDYNDSDVKYRAICICGKEKIVMARGKNIIAKSCGCKSKGNWKKGKRSPASEIDIYSSLRNSYRRDAVKRGYVFELTKKEFDELIIKPCYYCGREKTGKQMYNNWGLIEYTGIDRVDNGVGYVSTNVVPCCKDCNYLKKAVTPEIIKKAFYFLFGERND